MTCYDVFNGDADGITALIQLRLAEPKQTQLITGVKRDIALLDKIQAAKNDELCVLDISLEKNHLQVRNALKVGAKVFYVDHHKPGEVITHDNFNAIINTNSDVCTSLLVNGYLKQAYPLWAIVGAYGDNLNNSAQALAKHCAADLEKSKVTFNTHPLELLKQLGILINYNAYGLELDDLYFSPQQLYQAMCMYDSPFDFISQRTDVFEQLEQGYASDMQRAQQLNASYQDSSVAIYVLPDEAWSRRVNGVFGNALCQADPNRAHAVLIHKDAHHFMVSIRAPLNNKHGAGDFCSRYPSGGGREAAAGINALDKQQLDIFSSDFAAFYAK